MFAGKTIWEIFQIGGFTMYVLLLCSFLSMAVFLERVIYYRKLSEIKRIEFMRAIRRALSAKNIEKAAEICRLTPAPFSQVVYSGLELYNRSGKEISNAIEREITVKTIALEGST